MASQSDEQGDPDFSAGIHISDFGENRLLRGHVAGKPVVLALVEDEVFAIGAKCTHYQAPLEKGLIVGDTLRCPWHHACFSLRTGEAIGAPAIDALPCWQVERDGDRVIVRERQTAEPAAKQIPAPGAPRKIVIIGGGAAGFACAEMLRRRGYSGQLTMLSEDTALPCDRPNLSKDYLAGEIPEKWLPLKSTKFYEKHEIDLHLDTQVQEIDTKARIVRSKDGTDFPFDRLLIATGAEPIRLPIPGADQEYVFTLRTQADSDAIIARAKEAKTAVILGSGFIGLEVAAALRTHGLKVHVVSQDKLPLEKVLGPDFGQLVRKMHEHHGVTFHLENSITEIGERTAALKRGGEIDADLVIVGVGVKPRVALAEAAGLAVDHGILVNDKLETGVSGIYAAGDVASWPDVQSGARVRIEHWVLAQRHGQHVARNMLGEDKPFTDVPFFWSAHYGSSIRYVGHATSWDRIETEGDIAAGKGTASFVKDGRTLAMATIGCDMAALKYETALEQAGE